MKNRLNYYGKKREAIFFLIDYNLQNYYIQPLKELDSNIKYTLETKKYQKIEREYFFKKEYISFDRYKKAFDTLKQEMIEGNTYLLNLTFPTQIETNLTLQEIYDYSNAKFKLKFFDNFVCFSPERFIKINNNQIETYPMKGTIDAKIKNAKKIILENEKELAEHTMVVDLLRNDLSIVAKKVTVEKFRYIDRVLTNNKELLQISSKITAQLKNNWQNNLGDILLSLLPAGSITGTPKLSTTNIIKNIEKYNRGYFTGVFGVFDGKNLDSAVMIRFIEKNGNKFIYKSGGGVTIDSKVEDEYKEMCDKVYLPF